MNNYMEAKWYGKDVEPELGQKVIAIYTDLSDSRPIAFVEEYKLMNLPKGAITFLNNPEFVAWTPLPKSKEEMEKEQLKHEIKSKAKDLEHVLNITHVYTGDLSRSFLNEVADLLKRLS